jgi:alkanesulfonate monooxygenase SsuD/methylene tetrahydromethanopterin reductase-like flavin-dependent oxidoreductase (luciferase family)
MAHSGYFLAVEAAGTRAHPAAWRRADSRAEDLFTGRYRTGIRELIIELTARRQLAGTPAAVAERIDAYVRSDAADDFILAPHHPHRRTTAHEGAEAS